MILQKLPNGIIYEHLSKEAKRKFLIAELEKVANNIPDYKLAGLPEIMRKLVLDLTKL